MSLAVPMKRSKRYEKAIEHVKFLVKVEQEHPLTLNHYFSDTLEKMYALHSSQLMYVLILTFSKS